MAFVLPAPLPAPDPLRRTLRAVYRADETETVERIVAAATLPEEINARISARAHDLVAEARRRRLGKGGIDALLHEYALSTPEGVALMCLAEALLRIPDAATVDRLIRDKLAPADWARHLGHSDSLLVNASTWGLMLTGRLLGSNADDGDLAAALRRLLAARASRWCARR
jgi:RHH-type proline utilization regulon transcriptional repressor/proline dehydrogenase/delta 1-pyrroline-5-carboxylate dehydrogenase